MSEHNYSYYFAGGLAASSVIKQLVTTIEFEAPGWETALRWWEFEHLADYGGGHMPTPPTPDEMAKIGKRELDAVARADLVFVHLPSAGRGSHVELGAALAYDLPVYLLYHEEADLTGGRYPSVFYFHPNVVRIQVLPGDLEARVRNLVDELKVRGLPPGNP